MSLHEDRLREKDKSFKEMNAILKRLTALDKTEDDIKLCRAKAYWDDHRVAKATADDRQARVLAAQEELEEAQRSLETATQGGGAEEDQLKAVTDRMEAMQEEIAQAERELGVKAGKTLAVTRTLAGIKADLNKQTATKSEISGRIKTANKEVSFSTGWLFDVFTIEKFPAVGEPQEGSERGG